MLSIEENVYSFNRMHIERLIKNAILEMFPLKPKQLCLTLEIFYLKSTLNFGIPTVLVFQLDVYYRVDRLQTGLTAQQKGTTARWYSNKTSLSYIE